MCDHDIQINFHIKGLSLIDVSSEDDRLINSPMCDQIFSGYFDKYEKLEENKSRRMKRCNSRKSLTCDSSFFSSAAFLEPEEFSSMMGGNEKGEIRTLFGIEEDVNKSCDALTMLDSLEDDSVEPASSDVQKESEKADPMTVSSSKKLESINKDKVMHQGAPKKPNITMKQVFSRPPSSQSVGRSGVSTLSLYKVPKGVSRVGPISTTQTKMASLGAKDVKMEKDAKTVTGNRRSNTVRASLGSRKGLVTNSDDQHVLDSEIHHTHQSDDAEITGSLAESENRVPNPVPIKPSGLRPPSPKHSFSNGVRVTRHTRNRSMPSLPSAFIDLPIIGARSTNPSGGLNKSPLTNGSRNPKISSGITPKVQIKPSPKIGKESYSKDPGIGSAEKKIGSEQPTLVVKLGGKEGARIKNIKIVPLGVPDY